MRFEASIVVHAGSWGSGDLKKKANKKSKPKSNRTRDLIVHGTAHRGANGAAMPTDEGDQDGHFLFNHPERRGNFAAAKLSQVKSRVSPPGGT
jgi:hypothetical protein